MERGGERRREVERGGDMERGEDKEQLVPEERHAKSKRCQEKKVPRESDAEGKRFQGEMSRKKRCKTTRMSKKLQSQESWHRAKLWKPVGYYAIL